MTNAAQPRSPTVIAEHRRRLPENPVTAVGWELPAAGTPAGPSARIEGLHTREVVVQEPER